MKRLWLFVLAVSLPILGWAQSIPISGFVIDQYGQPVAGAQVYICSAAGSTGLPCSPVASIYYDYNLSLPAPNPYSTDANGDFSVYVGPLAFPNAYVVNAVPEAGTIYTWLYPGPSCPLSGCTFTGNVTATLFNATTSPYFEVNGVQLASTNLLDTSNIAYKNAANTFTGNPQTAPVWNATTGFEVNGVALASANLSDASNLAYKNASNNFTGTTNTFKAITGTTINATTGFEVAGVPLSAAMLSNGVSGTGAICLATGSACALSYTEYYQTVAANGVAQAQRATLNFSTRFALSDSSSPDETTVELATSGVTAGSYTLASMTVDGYGRVTAASSGSITYQMLARVAFTSCTLVDDGGEGSGCHATQSWGTTLPATYYWWCTAGPYSSGTLSETGRFTVNPYGATPSTATTFTYVLDNMQSASRGSTLPMACWATS